MILLLAVLLVGCGSSKKTAHSSNHQPTPVTDLKLSVGHSIDALPLYVAAQQGYFTAHHLNVTLMVQLNASERVSALQKHQVDGAVVGVPELMSANSTKAAGQIVSLTTNYVTIMTINDEVTSLADLNGGRVGVVASSTAAYATTQLLDHAGLTDTVMIQNYANEAELLAALNTGAVTAVSLPDPAASQLRRNGARSIAQTKAGQANTALVINQTMLVHHSDAMRQFMLAYNQAVRWLNSHPNSLDYQMILTKKLGYPATQVSALALPRFQTANAVSVQTIDEMHDWLAQTQPDLKLAPSAAYRSPLLAPKK
ncbi:hypothetical protein JCM31185_09770 [Furfurilactobacillus curtus]|uniref:Solute-binding protein family 3/N-terminal domain-containing protein n=1 Tax=Furfurilactobacillus curtus TaxID=1746200 RepID=A0ABQ5JQ08_9LACO